MATTALGQLRNQVRGETMTAEDPGYEEARRVYNAMIDGRPRVIVRCAGAEDVVAAVNLARESQLDLAVRGGSHSVPGFGTADDAVVIDYLGCKRSRLIPRRKRRGLRAAQRGSVQRCDPRSRPGHHRRHRLHHRHRRAHARRRDRLPQPRLWPVLRQPALGRVVVTADGKILTVSEQANEDLFWGASGQWATSASSPSSVSAAPGPGDLRRPDALRGG